eukprot:TRINITY_DN7848_c0_g1_i1.p1 TRINITY_DN7848_c0_g1~~TRINITY_DN7848_c0_g1_i1.p1  ORF type:complete len:1109 (-),score=362.16 TRINITY_DN7848_c0_g1_i1:43-3369(-)
MFPSPAAPGGDSVLDFNGSDEFGKSHLIHSSSLRLRNEIQSDLISVNSDNSLPPLADNDDVDIRPSFLSRFKSLLGQSEILRPRTIRLTFDPTICQFPPNVVRNQKYSLITFVPIVLYEQFKFFSNLYFLVVALSQFFPPLRVGFLFTYIAPLTFVLAVTMGKEALDDLIRWKRDKEANGEMYTLVDSYGNTSCIPSSEIKVGHVIQLASNQRVPADMLFLQTVEKSGTCFIRTDQLDGETDWKIRKSVAVCQKRNINELIRLNSSFFVDEPRKDIYSFIGNQTYYENGEEFREPLTVENTLWAGTVIASTAKVSGLVIFTGAHTRSAMNTEAATTKVGVIDLEINNISKILATLLILLSFAITAFRGFHGSWFVILFRFMLLFSAIIPISMRVNLDLAKSLYSYFISHDDKIPGTLVRNSTLPEELGRIQFLLSDKTGTLTRNVMNFVKLHLGTICYSIDGKEDVANQLQIYYGSQKSSQSQSASNQSASYKVRRAMISKLHEAILALALTHNVTPVLAADDKPSVETELDVFSVKIDEEDVEQRECNDDELRTYQASSPDEVALVKFTEAVGVTLVERTPTSMSIRDPTGDISTYEILNVFPFTSERKRMGIILKSPNGAITFFEKGADSIMSTIVEANDWLDEECGNMAREGLRTLVFGKKSLTPSQYEQFASKYNEARLSLKDREERMYDVIDSLLESRLELLAISGVEDSLQEGVRSTLEMLRNAGIKVWMLTGDKVETATCIAISSKLVATNQSLFQFVGITSVQEALQKIESFSHQKDCVMIVDGSSIEIVLRGGISEQFFQAVCYAPSVVCCRCSPTQKGEMVQMIKKFANKRTAAIGDGGNDVTMIQLADVGIGIPGNEGMHASLAADFSITQFSHLPRLVLWHGRNSYKRSAHLSQFIIHRGLIITIIQAVFSLIYFFAAIPVYNGILLVGYATIYTMGPVFSLVLDKDVSEEMAFTFPELFTELQKGRALSLKTFFIWVLTSVYQGGVIMLLSIFLFETELINIVGITFTSLILTELVNVAMEITTWHPYMVVSLLLTSLLYFASMILLPTTFDVSYITSWSFAWRAAIVTVTSCLPLYIAKKAKLHYDPPSYLKLH